jgi:hypothetical protein
MYFLFEDGNFKYCLNFHSTYLNEVDIITNQKDTNYATKIIHFNIVDGKIVWKDNAINYLCLTPAAVSYFEKIVKNLAFI